MKRARGFGQKGFTTRVIDSQLKVVSPLPSSPQHRKREREREREGERERERERGREREGGREGGISLTILRGTRQNAQSPTAQEVTRQCNCSSLRQMQQLTDFRL